MVPKKFAAVSPTSAHRFAILQPRHWTYNGNVVECVLRVGEQRYRLVIPWGKEPKLANAVCGLAHLPKNGNWGSKYLDLYKVLEGIGAPVGLDQTALRHALAHAPEVLNKRSTVERLCGLFGSVDIDLSCGANQRIFWRLFGELLVDADIILSSQLEQRLHLLILTEDKITGSNQGK